MSAASFIPRTRTTLRRISSSASSPAVLGLSSSSSSSSPVRSATTTTPTSTRHHGAPTSALSRAVRWSSSSSSSSSASHSSSSTTLDDLHKLLQSVTASYPHQHTLRMPTRLAPRQTWVELTQSRLQEQGRAGASSGGGGVTGSGLSEAMLAPKPMSASYVEMYLPFASSPSLVEKYIATSGLVRLGMLFQDLDTLAGACSYQHVLGAQPREGDSSNPTYIVTASVDRLDMLEPLYPDRSYRLCGQVIYTGSSSLEVLVTVDEVENVSGGASGEGGEAAAVYPRTVKNCLTGRFTMAARNAHTRKAQPIPPLQLNTDAERRLFAVGEELKARKREHSLSSLERVPPTQDESALLHRLHLQDEVAFARAAAGGKGEEGEGYVPVPVSATVLTSSAHMHPSHRNVHAKVFGGFLMRQAYELGWMCCALFKGGSSHAHQSHPASSDSAATPHSHDNTSPIPVRFLALDTLSFHAPVEIGSMLSLTARVDYSEMQHDATIHDDEHGGLQVGEDVDGDGTREAVAAVSVVAEVTDIATGSTRRTNTFRFSFALSASASASASASSSLEQQGREVLRRRVSPRSYAEAMEWVDGRRRIIAGREVRRGLA
ncbi:hypothetical protein V8E36_009386 [Tilletia maclaganii]